MHSAVQNIEKSLFWDSIRKEGYSVLVGKTLKKCGWKIAKFSCIFPSLWMENSIHMLINFHFQEPQIANYYS